MTIANMLPGSKIPDEGQTTFDRSEWIRLRLDTPLGVPVDCFHLPPGTCVKTGGLGEDIFCGIVHKHSQDDPRECIVIGHGWCDTDDERFVWRGTLAEFNRTWKID